MKNKKMGATIALIIVAIIWGSGFIFTKMILDPDDSGNEMGPFYFLSLRMGIATLALTPYIMYKHRNLFNKEKIKTNSFLGVILAVSFITLTLGAKYTTPSKNAFLNVTHVIFTPILLYLFYKTKIKFNTLIAIFLTLVGVYLLTSGGGHAGSSGGSGSELLGDMFSLVSGLFFAFHIMFINKFNKKTSPIFMSYIQFLTATIIFLIATIVTGEEIFIPSGRKLLFLMYLIVFNTIISFVLQISAQKYLAPTKASLILITEAMFATIFSVLFYKEKFTLIMLLGFGLIFISLIVAEVNLRKKKALHLPHVEDIH